MSSDVRHAAAARLSRDKAGGATSATSCFVGRETMLYWSVAGYRRLYSNTLDSRRFEAVFSDRWNSNMFDRWKIRRATDFDA